VNNRSSAVPEGWPTDGVVARIARTTLSKARPSSRRCKAGSDLEILALHLKTYLHDRKMPWAFWLLASFSAVGIAAAARWGQQCRCVRIAYPIACEAKPVF